MWFGGVKSIASSNYQLPISNSNRIDNSSNGFHPRCILDGYIPKDGEKKKKKKQGKEQQNYFIK